MRTPFDWTGERWVVDLLVIAIREVSNLYQAISHTCTRELT